MQAHRLTPRPGTAAAERWPLAVALSHFGAWSHLGAARPSATDIFPNTATLSFRTAS